MASLTRRSAAALLLSSAALVVYATMWLGYRHHWGWLDGADSSTLTAAYDVGVKHPGWVRFWDGLCTVLAPATFRLLGWAAILVALAKRRLRVVLFLAVSVEMTEFVTRTAKGLADRPRPVTALVAAQSSSFPSGHALGAMVGVAALLTVIVPLLRPRVRLVAIAAGVVIVVMVGVGRVALNVHNPSDVLAGWSLGYVYFALCRWLVRPLGGGRPTADAPQAA
ncbi:MAG TPA: phosphatase PAP2 family protein [Mycobacterium sp.]